MKTTSKLRRAKGHSKHGTRRDRKAEALKRNTQPDPTEAYDFGDTTEILDPATLEEMMQLIQRIEEDDLPPAQIILTHHVKRPRQVRQSPDARVILRYTPPDPRKTAELEAEDLAQQIEEAECNDAKPSTN